jgi:uncharacterized protein YcnI
MKRFFIVMIMVVSLLLGASPAEAHVTVKPGEIGVGARSNFTVSVPTEEDHPTIQVRLVIPEGLQSVRPNVKSGWNIQLKKTGEGEESKITEIIWSGGKIPAEQRDEFVFSAQAPAEETSLVWKAYQTYADGSVVAWDNSPEVVAEYTKNNPVASGHEDNHAAPRPYSSTKVTNDLKVTSQPAVPVSQKDNSRTLSLVALLIAAASLGMQFYHKK